jgi:hypothetical protein
MQWTERGEARREELDVSAGNGGADELHPKWYHVEWSFALLCPRGGSCKTAKCKQRPWPQATGHRQSFFLQSLPRRGQPTKAGKTRLGWKERA